MRFKKFFITLSLFSILIIITFYWLFFLPNILVENKRLEFYIKKNTSFCDFFEEIRPHLRSKKSFELASKFKKFNKNLRPGRYLIEETMSNNDLINNLRVKNIPIKLTFNNIKI